jgi:hypothetical protein
MHSFIKNLRIIVLTSNFVFYKIRIALEQIKCSKTKSYLGRLFLANRRPDKILTKTKTLKANTNLNFKRLIFSEDKTFLINLN